MLALIQYKSAICRCFVTVASF